MIKKAEHEQDGIYCIAKHRNVNAMWNDAISLVTCMVWFCECFCLLKIKSIIVSLRVMSSLKSSTNRFRLDLPSNKLIFYVVA